MKTVYAYNPITNEYIGTDEAPRNPKNQATYLIPAFTTEEEPPEANENQRIVWGGEGWLIEEIPQPEPEPEPTPEELRQQEIRRIEGLLNDRYAAHSKLLATGATQQELDECQAEIQIILAELEVKYNESA